MLATAILAGTWSISFAQSKIPGYLSVGGWIDGQYSYELQENNAVTPAIKDETSTFQLRRARLDFKGGVTDKIDFHPFIKNLVLSASALKGTTDNGAEKNARNNRYSFGGEYKDDALSVRSGFLAREPLALPGELHSYGPCQV